MHACASARLQRSHGSGAAAQLSPAVLLVPSPSFAVFPASAWVRPHRPRVEPRPNCEVPHAWVVVKHLKVVSVAPGVQCRG